jgi:capsular exopolysaccharide synthesis family protein
MPQQIVPIWHALKRWWWLMVASAVLAGVSAYVYWQNQPPVFQAHIALMIGNSAQSVNPDPQQIGIERTLANFYSEMAKRRPITQAVIQRLGLQMPPEKLAASIETRVVADAQILEIHVFDLDPRQAALLATGVAEELIRQSPSTNVMQGDTLKFIQLQIADLEQKITKIDSDLTTLHDRMAGMTSASDLSEAQATAKELETLKQTYSTIHAQYLAGLNNQTVNSLSIIEPASVPSQPVSIGLAATVLIAVAGGLMLSIGAIVVLEYADDVMRWSDATTILNLPVLGAVPKWGDAAHPMILPTEPQSPEADALRSLRAQIGVGDGDSPIRKMVVTSPSPRDGKSFTAINLAVAAAAAGLRTILIDGDLRLGSLHRFLECPSEPGLSDLLRRAARSSSSSENVLQATSIDNLRFVPIGRPVLDPASLLSKAKLEALTDALLVDADVVIVDTPPVGIGPDATLMAAACDAVVLVVNANRTRRGMTVKAISTLERYNLIGLIFNRLSMSRVSGQYYHYYSQTAQRRTLLGRIKSLPSKVLRRPRPKPGPPALPAPAEASPASSPQPADSDQLHGDNGQAQPALETDRINRQEAADRMWTAVEAADRDDSIILTTAEAAERLKTTEEIVRGWCAAGRLPAVRIGKQWLVTGLTLQEGSPHANGEHIPPRE